MAQVRGNRPKSFRCLHQPCPGQFVSQYLFIFVSDLLNLVHVSLGSQINGFPPQSNGIASPHPLSAGSLPAHQSIPSSPQSPVSFTPDQLSALKNQIAAFKALQKGEPIPEHLRNALLPQTHANTINNLEKPFKALTLLLVLSTQPSRSTVPRLRLLSPLRQSSNARALPSSPSRRRRKLMLPTFSPALPHSSRTTRSRALTRTTLSSILSRI